MKKLFTLLTLAQLASCASVKDLQTAKSCKVWEDQPVVGPFAVDVKQNEAYWEGRCSLMGFFLCKWVKTELDGEKLFMNSNGIFNSKTHAASLKKKTINYEKTFADSIAQIKPIVIDSINKKAILTTDVFNGKLSSSRTIEFNNACRDEQVAMGIITLVTAKNKIN